MSDLYDSVKVVTNDSGMVVTSHEYLPFGEDWITEGDTKNAPKYNSQELDKESGYYFYNARHYDPEIGRFVTPDTVIDGEDTTIGWNRFAYCGNNPIKYSDPTGHFFGLFGKSAGTQLRDNNVGGQTRAANVVNNAAKNQLKQSTNTNSVANKLNTAKDTSTSRFNNVISSNANNNVTYQILKISAALLVSNIQYYPKSSESFGAEIGVVIFKKDRREKNYDWSIGVFYDDTTGKGKKGYSQEAISISGGPAIGYGLYNGPPGARKAMDSFFGETDNKYFGPVQFSKSGDKTCTIITIGLGEGLAVGSGKSNTIPLYRTDSETNKKEIKKINSVCI